MRETTVSLIPKEEIAFLKEDKKFTEFIINELTKQISDRLIQILETNDEIIIKKPVLRVSEYWPTYSVEYRKSVDWEPLVRCKDCKQHEDEEPGMVYCPIIVGGWVSKDFFCKWGKRREEGGASMNNVNK